MQRAALLGWRAAGSDPRARRHALVATALVLFGGDSIRHFVIILLVGIFSGTYSSIFNASPILVVWQNKEWRNWFRPKAIA